MNKIALFLYFLISTTSAFIHISTNISPVKEITVKDLFNKINTNELENIIVSPKLDTIIGKDLDENVFTTKINSLLIPKIIDSTIEHNINTEFIENEPKNIFKIVNIPTILLGYLLFLRCKK